MQEEQIEKAMRFLRPYNAQAVINLKPVVLSLSFPTTPRHAGRIKSTRDARKQMNKKHTMPF